MMNTILRLQDNLLSLEHGDFYEQRSFSAADTKLLQDCAAQYRQDAKQLNAAAQHLANGQALYQWLNGQGWLTRCREHIKAPWLLEIRSSANPEADEQALLDAPWELLADEQGHLGRDPLLRFSPLRRLGQPGARPEPSPYRLSLVFMAAAPEGQAVLSYEAEEAAILEAAKSVDLSVEESGSLDWLKQLVHETSDIQLPNGQRAHCPPDVLHLSCHGGFQDQQPVLMLESETGAADAIRAADLLNASVLQNCGLLFVSACHSADSGTDGGAVADALAVQLIRGGFRAVLGWGAAVSDVEASAFAKHLYQQLAEGAALEIALAAARAALLQERPDSLDWHLARLFLSSAGGGVLSHSRKARRMLSAEHGSQVFLDPLNRQVRVARRGEFVGRRRYLQQLLREQRKPQHAGVLIHGMGRQGKSSLAARFANRLPDHKVVLVFEHYRAQDVLNAFVKAGLGQTVSDICDEYEKTVRDNPKQLSNALHMLKLALADAEVKIIQATAEAAVHWLYNTDQYREAAKLGQAAIAALEQARIKPALLLLRDSADALGRTGDTPSARNLYRQALDTHQAEENPYHYAALLVSYARRLVDDGEPERALDYFTQALQYLPQAEYPRDYALALGGIARIKASKGEIDAALSQHEECREIFEALGDQRSWAVTLGDIARIKVSKGEIDAALSQHEERLEVFKALSDQRERAVTLSDIARIKFSRGETDVALRLYKEITHIFKKLGDQRSRALTLGATAEIYLQRGDLEQAHSFYKKQLLIAEDLEDMGVIAHAHWGLGRVYQQQQDSQTALDHLNQSYAINQNLGRLDGIVFVGLDLGPLLCMAGHQDEGIEILQCSHAGLLQLGQAERAAQVAALITLMQQGSSLSA